jgi:hypothetical protein
MREHFAHFVVTSNAAIGMLAITHAYFWYRFSRVCSYGFWFDALNAISYASLAAWLVGLLVVTSGCFILRLSTKRSTSYIAASVLIGPALLTGLSWFVTPCGC